MPNGLYRSGSYVYLSSYTGNASLRKYNTYDTNNTFGATNGNYLNENSSNSSSIPSSSDATANPASESQNGNTDKEDSPQTDNQSNPNQGGNPGNQYKDD